MVVTLQSQAKLEPIILVNSSDSFSCDHFNIRHFLRLKKKMTLKTVFSQGFQHGSDSQEHLNKKFHMKTAGETDFN